MLETVSRVSSEITLSMFEVEDNLYQEIGQEPVLTQTSVGRHKQYTQLLVNGMGT